MNILIRSTLFGATLLLTIPDIAPQGAWAQTPAQMQYERQQREYRQQMERQSQEQQRQQQLMNQNARRQHKQSRRDANALTPKPISPGLGRMDQNAQGGGWSPSTPSSASGAGGRPESRGQDLLRFNTVYSCNGERVVVTRCRSDSDDAFCSLQYPDRKGPATGGIVPELAERRGVVVKKLQGCQGGKS